MQKQKREKDKRGKEWYLRFHERKRTREFEVTPFGRVEKRLKI